MQSHLTDGKERVQRLVMTVNMQATLIFTCYHQLHHQAHHPHTAEDMVGMSMRNKKMMDILKRNIHLLQLPEDSITPAGIH